MESRGASVAINNKINHLVTLCFYCITSFIAGCDGQLSVAEAPDATQPLEAQAGRQAYASAVNMRLVGRHDLQARSAYQPIVHAYGERPILFVGHHAGE